MVPDAFHLFIYGSLKSDIADGPGPSILAGCERVGTGSVRGTLYDLGEYPALLLGGEDEVAGEVWRCPAEKLRVLDEYESTAQGLFRRAAARVGGHACWVYLAGPKLGPRLLPSARVRGREWKP